ncbi:MAG: patatin [Candidatus Rokuibacteriota bacterium]|nr:MAG: patatin [Candidatus Rokubacteria bacterium]
MTPAETGSVEAAASPVHGDEPEELEPGIALCLSGGGYRAMLFHAGAVRRLNELGYLPQLKRVSSVSGGSITNGVLAATWTKLRFENGVASNLDELFLKPIRHLATKTIDMPAVFKGILLPGTISDRIADSYRNHVFGTRSLRDLPDEPRFVFDATSMQTGALFRFSKPYMADYTVGLVPNPDVDLATAVAASSAFPPILSPVVVDIDPDSWDPSANGPLHQPPYTTQAVLSDGGVYDNLGLETAWKRHRTVFVSDGGGRMGPQPSPRHDWPRHAYRTLSVIDTQVRSLRKRQVVAGYLKGERDGTYWGIRSHIGDYGPPDGSLPCTDKATTRLADTATRLAHMDDTLQERLINWGYAICDAAMRRWVDTTLPAPAGFPYPSAGVG